MTQILRCDAKDCINFWVEVGGLVTPWITMIQGVTTRHYCGQDCLAKSIAPVNQIEYPGEEALVVMMVESIDLFYTDEQDIAGDPPEKIRLLASWLVDESWKKKP